MSQFYAFLLVVPFAPSAVVAQEKVELKRDGKQIQISIGEKAFGTYYFGPESPKPYLSPLRSADGIVLTRGWPMIKNIPGESHDHPHHRALFFTHGDINGFDFWGEAVESKKQQTTHGKVYSSEELPKGRTVFVKLLASKGGPDSGTLSADLNLVDPDGKPIGSETQTYVFRGDATSRTIDCTFTTNADKGVPLKFGDTKEGTFAIRLVKALEEPNGHMLNSNGATGEKAIWGKRADWVDYSGIVEGEELGIAIFDHPSNLHHPSTWHARGYGLFAVNPFGLHDFMNDPKQDGSYTVPVGDSLTLRYRVFIHKGDAADSKVGEAYRAYAAGKN
ncbi:MAG: transmembrane prediction [Acidobacteria bacterium]|nr:MAG: transmembrane prediction [Acidobacteriota bacterium]